MGIVGVERFLSGVDPGMLWLVPRAVILGWCSGVDPGWVLACCALGGRSRAVPLGGCLGATGTPAVIPAHLLSRCMLLCISLSHGCISLVH